MIKMTFCKKLAFADLPANTLFIENGFIFFSKTRDPDNQIEADNTNPDRNTIRDKTVVVSPAENVAA